MASLTGITLDANVQEAGEGFEVLPKAHYKMVIVSDELKPTKAGTGKYLAFKLQVIEGPHAQKTVTDNINLVNPSQVCQAIGQGVLKKICNLCGVQYPPQDTTGLYGKPMDVNMDIQTFKSNKSGNELQSNVVKGYGAIKTQAVAAPAKDEDEVAPW